MIKILHSGEEKILLAIPFSGFALAQEDAALDDPWHQGAGNLVAVLWYVCIRILMLSALGGVARAKDCLGVCILFAYALHNLPDTVGACHVSNSRAMKLLLRVVECHDRRLIPYIYACKLKLII